MKINIPGVEAKPVSDIASRLSLLIWGPAGAGKTTLAATAPGRKLVVLFDPGGADSLRGVPDVSVLDLSSQPNSIVTYAKGDDKVPFGLADAVADFDTLIVDSLTTFAAKALGHAISSGFAGNNTSLDRPGIAGYTYRSSTTMQMIMNCLNFTGKHNKHCIFIAHEAAPETNDSGAIIRYSLEMGGSTATQVPNRISEVWYLFDPGNNKSRSIMIRPARLRSPMKTRMFVTDAGPEFEWKYDTTKHEGATIASWFDAWQTSKAKLLLPK